jgi:hypothetical protein
MLPTLPFIYLMLSILLWEGGKLIFKRRIHLQIYVITAVVFVSILFGLSYLISVLRTDTRLAAANWANSHIEHDATILSEVYDPGIIPFNSYFPNITLFDFYTLEQDTIKQAELHNQLQNTQYIILPSQRIESSRVTDKKEFPVSSQFYNSLYKSGHYRLIYQTPCDFWCTILYLGNPIFEYEETASVFDRPTISIYQQYK